MYTFIGVFVFWSVHFIAVEIEMPYGDDPNDLPLETITTRFNDNLMMLLQPHAQHVPELVSDPVVWDSFTSSATMERCVIPRGICWDVRGKTEVGQWHRSPKFETIDLRLAGAVLLRCHCIRCVHAWRGGWTYFESTRKKARAAAVSFLSLGCSRIRCTPPATDVHPSCATAAQSESANRSERDDFELVKNGWDRWGSQTGLVKSLTS